MRIGRARIVLNRDGVGQVLRRTQTQDMLRRKADAVAAAVAAAGITVDGEPGSDPLTADVTVTGGGSRARATVAVNHPAGQAVEAKHRLLGSAVDAARNA